MMKSRDAQAVEIEKIVRVLSASIHMMRRARREVAQVRRQRGGTFRRKRAPEHTNFLATDLLEAAQRGHAVHGACSGLMG